MGMSLYQWPRTEEQDQFFQHGLDCLQYVYGHQDLRVLQQKQLPPGPEMQLRYPEFVGNYDSRGWCTFEAWVAGTMKRFDHLLDLKDFTNEVTLDDFGTHPSLKANRTPPTIADDFDAL